MFTSKNILKHCYRYSFKFAKIDANILPYNLVILDKDLNYICNYPLVYREIINLLFNTSSSYGKNIKIPNTDIIYFIDINKLFNAFTAKRFYYQYELNEYKGIMEFRKLIKILTITLNENEKQNIKYLAFKF